MTQGAPAQACRPLMLPRRSIRNAVMLQTPMSFCCRFERNLAALRPLAVAKHGDVVVIAEAAHALLRPGIAVPGLDASAIEQARDLPIRHQPRQLTHECDRVVGDAWIVPAGPVGCREIAANAGYFSRSGEPWGSRRRDFITFVWGAAVI